MRRRLLGALALALAAAGTAWAWQPAAAPRAETVPSEAALRLYLAQSLSSLARAYQLAQQARQYGTPRDFDLDRFLAELSAVANGLERYLLPHAPPPGPHVQVEITGQYLYDGLARSAERARPKEPAP